MPKMALLENKCLVEEGFRQSNSGEMLRVSCVEKERRDMAKEKMDRSRQKDTFIKVLNYMKPYWFYLALSLVLAAVTVALTLYLPKLTGFAVDEIIEQGR